MLDMLIIGAGPAGLAAGIAAKRLGLRALILEKGTLVNSLLYYPTNMVFFTVDGTGLTVQQLYDRLLAQGVRIGTGDGKRMRAVTHLDVTRAGIEKAVEAVRNAVAGRV